MFNICIERQRAGEPVNAYTKEVRAIRILKTATPLAMRQLLSGKLQRQQKNRCSSIGSLAVHLHKTACELDKDLGPDDIPDPLSSDRLYDCFHKSGLDLPTLDKKYKDLDTHGDEYYKIMVCVRTLL